MKRMLFCISLIAFMYGCKTNNAGSPKTTVSSFIDAARSGNIVEVKKHLTKSDISLIEMGENMLAKFDPAGAKEMKDKMAKEFQEKTKDARVEIKDEKIEGDNATVDVLFNYEGRSETRPFSLVKEDGMWKISLMSTGMKNAGKNNESIEEDMKNLNMDSLKESINEGMKEFNNMNKDSLKQVIEQGFKDAEKLKKSNN